MLPPPKIVEAQIDSRKLQVRLESGVTVLMPLAHVPTLLLATDEERAVMEVFAHSLRWEALDCDLGVEGLLAGSKEMPARARKAFEKFFTRQFGQQAA